MFKRVSSSTSVRDRNSEEERDQDQEPPCGPQILTKYRPSESRYSDTISEGRTKTGRLHSWWQPTEGVRILGASGDGSTVDDTVLSTNTRGVGMPQDGIRAEVTRGRDWRTRKRSKRSRSSRSRSAKVEATVEAKAEAETADLDSPGRPPRVERTTGEASD
ncbi:hypothetical protein EVAR_94772_1 [Eumeta japonica]|uniref:Uncharacterized protein n=1 Tax=Eumeta variegata TaxID=151549 RepID=A0A4C2AD58_EUMVA|nr:hypothetical protein EVAR_94772_1 [Eumeta japonica]